MNLNWQLSNDPKSLVEQLSLGYISKSLEKKLWGSGRAWLNPSIDLRRLIGRFPGGFEVFLWLLGSQLDFYCSILDMERS